MKKKLALVSLIMLVTICTFGQKEIFEKHEKYIESRIEQHLKGSDFEDRINIDECTFQKNREDSQNALLKSVQFTKQRLDSIIEQHWDESTNQWVGDWKYECTYDANGNRIIELNYNWDESTNQWVGRGKYEYTYDANGNRIIELSYYWDESTNQWVGSEKYEDNYDANGNLIIELSYNWDESTNQWVGSGKYEYTYDANGNLILELNYNWDESTNQWVGNWKYEYTYDANGNRIIELSYNWDESTNQWVADRKYIYYYSEQNVTNINNVETEIVRLYPNPVSEYLNFSFTNNSNTATFELFDVQGHILISKEVYNDKKISLANLNSGMYLYNLYINGNRQSGKLIKK